MRTHSTHPASVWLLLLAALAAAGPWACDSTTRSGSGQPRQQSRFKADPAATEWAHYETGFAYELEEEWARAVKQYTLASDFAPASARILVRLGRCQLLAGNRQASLISLSRAAQLGADSVEIHELQAQAYASALKLQEAANQWLRVIELEPLRESAYHALYDVYRLLDDSERAMAVLGDLAKQLPNPEAVHIRMAELYVSLNQYDKALLHYLVVKERYPNYKLNDWRLVICYEQLGQIPRAITVMELLLASDPGNPGWLYKLADLYATAQRRPEAKRLLIRLIRQSTDPLSPHTVDAHIGLADLWLGEAKPNNAIAQLNDAAQAGSAHYRIFEKLGDIEMQRQRFSKAVADFAQALTLSPPADAVERLREKLANARANKHLLPNTR